VRLLLWSTEQSSRQEETKKGEDQQVCNILSHVAFSDFPIVASQEQSAVMLNTNTQFPSDTYPTTDCPLRKLTQPVRDQ